MGGNSHFNLTMYYVYIIRCENNSLYTGIAKDIVKRMSEHFGQSSKKAKYTRAHTPVAVEALWRCENKSEALKAEYHIKQMTKKDKETLIKNNVAPEKTVLELLNINLERINVCDIDFTPNVDF